MENEKNKKKLWQRFVSEWLPFAVAIIPMLLVLAVLWFLAKLEGLGDKER